MKNMIGIRIKIYNKDNNENKCILTNHRKSIKKIINTIKINKEEDKNGKVKSLFYK